MTEVLLVYIVFGIGFAYMSAAIFVSVFGGPFGWSRPVTRRLRGGNKRGSESTPSGNTAFATVFILVSIIEVVMFAS